MFGGKTVKGKDVLEPFQTLADNSKANLILNWVPQGNLRTWVKNYKKILNI